VPGKGWWGGVPLTEMGGGGGSLKLVLRSGCHCQGGFGSGKGSLSGKETRFFFVGVFWGKNSVCGFLVKVPLTTH